MATALLSKGSLIFGSATPRVFEDFAEGDYLSLEFGNPDSTRETGRGGSIITKNLNSNQATLTVRLIKGSPNDIFLTGVRNDYERDPAKFVLMSGSVYIAMGDGKGEVTTENYDLSEGSFQNKPGFKPGNSVEGGVAVWTFDVTAKRSFS
jgi:hypothetical protein